MANSQRIPWLRIGAESIAIVASILLAFAIDAWWDDRQQRAAEGQALAVVLEEIDTNLQILKNRQQGRNRDQALLVQFYELPTSELSAVRERNAEAFIYSLVKPNTEDFSRGTLAGLVNSGAIADIRDDRVTAALAGWTSSIGSLEEVGATLNSLQLRALQLISKYDEFQEIEFAKYQRIQAGRSPVDFDDRKMMDLRPIRGDPDIRSTAIAMFQQRGLYDAYFRGLISSLEAISAALRREGAD